MKHLKFDNKNFKIIAEHIKNGDVAVLPTDTLYGISASAFNKEAVQEIYKIKEREQDKPFIILVSKIEEIEEFGINIDLENKKLLLKNWPAPLSVVFECPNEAFSYLHRKTKSLAFRIPAYNELLDLLKLTGPITSTTVNISGEPAITNIQDAINKFGDKIDLYVDLDKDLNGKPSTVIKIIGKGYEILRQGEYSLKL